MESIEKHRIRSKKINDSIISARELLNEMINLQRALHKAKGWSIGDIIGGSLFKGKKYQYLREAEDSSRKVKRLNKQL